MTAHAALHLTPTVLNPALLCDAELTLPEIDKDLYDWIQRLAPFGNAAPEPIFLTRNVTLAAPVRAIQDRHICLCLHQEDPSRIIEALGWTRAIDWIARSQQLALAPGVPIDILYRIRTSNYQQTSKLQLELIDARPAT